MISRPDLTLAALAAASVAQSQFFSYRHNALTRTRMDPIVTPGKVAGHTHLFAGTNAIDSHMDHTSATAGDCTTAPITADKSGYWAPQLYYKWKNGTYTAISGDGIVTYWLNRGNDVSKGEKSVVVPEDFRMVAGNTTRDFLDVKIPSHDAVSFECFGSGYDYRLPFIPADFECENIRPQISFPNCWNEVDSYKADNSHVAYSLNDYQNGPCPAGFKRIPTLFVETYYKPRLSLGPEYEWYPGCFVLSNGDNFGLTYHADWLNGIPRGLINDAFDQCPTMNSNVKDCPLLAQYMQSGDAANCRMKGEIVNEAVGIQTPLAKLPGNNPVFNSSKIANNPKRPDPNYVEKSSIITFDIAKGGSCHSQQCTDYTGGQGAESAETSTNTTSSLSTATTATSTASSTASPTSISTSRIGNELNAGPQTSLTSTSTSTSTSTQVSSQGSGGSGNTCGRRQKRRLSTDNS